MNRLYHKNFKKKWIIGDCPKLTDAVIESGPSPNLKTDFRLSTDSGFTLTELMVAIVVGMIIISATYSTYIAQQRSFSSQDQVAEMNTTSKIALNIIANDIREAGFGVTLDPGTYNVNGFSTVITAIDSTTAPDQMTLVAGFRRAGTLCGSGTLANIRAVRSSDTQLILRRAGSSNWIINNGDRRNITVSGLSFGVVATGPGTGVREAITLQNPIGSAYPPYYRDLNNNDQCDSGEDNNCRCDDGEGIPVYVVEDHTYRVVGMDLQRVRRLAGNPDTDVIAENIEDLQIAYGVDTNDDGVIDLFRNAPLVTDKILRIRLNILARAARGDMDFQGQGNPPATIENRNHTATNDNFKRRWWQMEIDVRNPI